MPGQRLERLQGTVLGLAFALNITLKRHPDGEATRNEIGDALDVAEAHLKNTGSPDRAFGIALIRKTLLGRASTAS